MKAYLSEKIQGNKNFKIKIAFGSGFNPFETEHDIFKYIDQYDPQIFMWLGEFAYTDYKGLPGYFQPGSREYREERFKLT